MSPKIGGGGVVVVFFNDDDVIDDEDDIPTLNIHVFFPMNKISHPKITVIFQ